MHIITHYLLVVVFAILLPHTSLANTAIETKPLEAKPIEIIYQQQVHLNVASDAVNRINFDNFRVVKLIGNISSITCVLSDSGSDLFISPKLPEGKKIDFSALLSSGDIIDFSLKVVKSQTPYLVKLKFGGDIASQNKSEATKMIEAMSRGKPYKYYVQKSNSKIDIPLSPEIKAIEQDSYRFGNLHGTSLILENTNYLRPLEIAVDDLIRIFDGVVAISIEQGLLPPKGKTKAYIVFKEKV